MPRLSVTFLTVLLLAPLPGRAEVVSPGDLQALARHTQSLQAVYAHGLAISMDMDEAEALIDLYVEGGLPEPDTRRQVADVRARVRGAIGDYKAALDALPPRPRIADDKRERGLQAFEGMVRGLTANLEAQWRLLERLMETAASGDGSAYDRASADSLALAGDLIDAENTAVEAALLGAGPGHPQRGLYHSSIGSNLAMRAALILLEDSKRGGKPRVDDARGAIEQGLARAERGIESGRRDAGAMLAKIGGGPAVTAADRIGKRFIQDLVAAYGRAFDDEARIVAVMRGFLDALVAAMEAPQTEATVRLTMAAQAFQADIVGLVDARLDEQNARMRLVEEFSAAMAAAQ